MQKIIMAMMGMMFAMGLSGCMGSNTQDMGSPNMIKVIREPKHSSVSDVPIRRKIQTGKIETVDYNSSIISPERAIKLLNLKNKEVKVEAETNMEIG